MKNIELKTFRLDMKNISKLLDKNKVWERIVIILSLLKLKN